MITEQIAPQQVSPKSYLQSWSFLQRLFEWREVPGFGLVEAVVLALFYGVAVYTLHFHELWDDEAQAWLIARDNSAWQIVVHRLHYEGAPPLWHLLLHLFYLCHGTYTGIGLLGASFAAAGVYVLLRWSPFPLIIRVLLPFTFFFQYQYAVIARGYVLFPLLTFLLCVIYTQKRGIIWFALVGGLLANISLHGFIVALSLSSLYLFDLIRSKRRLDRSRAAFVLGRKRLVAAALLFFFLVSVSVYTSIPAPDLNFAIGDEVSTGPVHRILMSLIGETPRNAPRTPRDPPNRPGLILPKPDRHTAPAAWLAWKLNNRWQDPSPSHPAQMFILTIIADILDALSQATWPIANSNILACLFLAATVLWLRRRGALRMLLPWGALIGVGILLWTAEHHAGMLLVALFAGIWIAAYTQPTHVPSLALNRAFVGIFALVLVLQIAWSVYCIRADVYGSYDPGPETAAWLQANPKDRVAAFRFQTVSIQPWFSHSPFFNVPTSWWQWSSNVEVDGIHRTIMASRPDAVVYGVEFPGYGQIRDQWLHQSIILEDEEKTLPGDVIVNDLRTHGYHETHRFCGTRFARFSSAYRICDLIFEPN